jgi:hypothetical protein
VPRSKVVHVGANELARVDKADGARRGTQKDHEKLKTKQPHASIVSDHARRCQDQSWLGGTYGIRAPFAQHVILARAAELALKRFQVEREYGMAASYYGRTIEIDHIVPLELGGSNDIANLYPEPGSGDASYHVKDELENKLHDLVCAGAITLRAAQRQIAADWRTLYKRVFGVAP